MRFFTLFFLSTLWFGCAGDAPIDVSSCTKNGDCDAGFYCGANNFCKQDCDPAALNDGCKDGLSCDPIGRCVVSGDCASDGDCDSPPNGTCDEDALLSYANEGKCELVDGKGVCKYPSSSTLCEAGCLNDACIEECDAATCTNPPSAACDIDGVTAVTYEPAGFCENNGCSYTQIPVSCAVGCLNGECVAGGCDVQPCSTPPNDRCSGNTVYNYGEDGVCREEEGAAICDYSLDLFHCGYVGGECENAQCVGTITQLGGVVVVEYQVNPVGSFMDLTEWFEIVNTSGADIDLTNWIIRSKSTTTNDEHIIGSTGEAVPAFPAGGRLLFARAPLGGIEVDYDYPARSNGTGITFSNNTDWLRILNPAGEIVDHVFYESGSIIPGSSRKYDPTKPMTAADNDDFKSWCPSLTDAYTGAPENYGTPGEVNTPCNPDPCAGFVCEKPEDFCASNANRAVNYLADSAMCRATRFNNPFCDYQSVPTDCVDGTELCSGGACLTIPANIAKNAGDLIISEVMGNPAGRDTDREWIEIHNTTGAEISLFGMKFEAIDAGQEKQSYQILDLSAVVPANGYVVLIRDTDPLNNGGIMNAILFRGTHLKNSNYFDEGNIADPNDDIVRTLRLTSLAGVTLDESFYGNLEVFGAGIKSGISNQLKSANLNAADNDIAQNWCEGLTDYGEGGKGTPGAANDCP